VVSDYDSVNLLRTAHRTAHTEGEAAVQAPSAGLDVELPGSPNYSHLVDEVPPAASTSGSSTWP